MKIKVAFLSAGLGHVLRGFETSTLVWYEEVKATDRFDVTLFSGGHEVSAVKVWNCPRNGCFARLLRKFKLIKDGCRLEQITFSIGFLFHLVTYRPSIIWLQEGILGNMLLTFRRVFGFKYKLMFCDGAPVGYNFAKRFDFLIFLHQYALNEACTIPQDLCRCKVIPHLTMSPDQTISKKEAKDKLGIESNQFVMICVAAWNKYHKRIDYLLEEVAKLDFESYTLLLCGQPELDSRELQELALSLKLNVRWYTITQRELSIAYLASDLFVLPSLHEGLGAVLIEAGFHQLPIICHPHAGGKYVLGEDYKGFVDLSVKGNLAGKISEVYSSSSLPVYGVETRSIVTEKFDKQKLLHSLTSFIEYAEGYSS